MEKSILLKFSGNLDPHGFEVVVEVVNADGKESRSEGHLPACPILEDKYQKWHSALQNLAKIKNPQHTVSRNVTIFQKIQLIRESRQEAKDRYKDAEKSLIEMMNNWLRSESFMPIREILDNQISYSKKGRLIVRTSNLQLKRLPWESWEWLSFGNRQVTISYSSINFVSPPHTTQKLIRIIAVIGQATNLNLQEDLHYLRNQLPSNAILEPLINQSRVDLLEHLKKSACDIFYFAGHSKSESDRAKIWINESEYLQVKDLKNTIKKMRLNRLKLAIFNSCDGLGLADDLDEENLSIPNLIVMRDAIHDRVAHKFLKELLIGFINEKLPLHQAVAQAREALESLEGEFPGSSLQPILISGSTQNQTYQSWLEKPISQHQLFKLLINSLIITLGISSFKSIGWLQQWEWQTYDLMVKLERNESIEPRILVVEVMQEDTNNLEGEYPLKDKTLLEALQKLDRYQPKAIGIDIFRDRPQTKDPQAIDEYEKLVKYWQDREYIVPICVHSDRDVSAKSVTINQEQVGFVDVPLDTDGVIRRNLLAVEIPGSSPCQASYSLGAYLALTYLYTKGYQIKSQTNNVWEIYHPQTQKVVRWEALQPYSSFYYGVKNTSGFQVLLKYRHTNSIEKISRRVTLTQILKGEVPATEIRDRIILIGVTDPSLAKDEFNTPYREEIRGLWLHAHMVSQLVSSVEDGRSLLKFLDWQLQILLVWLLSITALAINYRFNYFISLKIFGVILVLMYTIILGAFMTQSLIIPIIPATLALLIPLLSGLIATASSLQREYSQADTL